MTKKSGNLQNVVFRLSPEEIDRLDYYAARYGKTRSDYLRTLIILGIEEDEVFEKIGLIRAGITVREIIGWMGNKARKGSEGSEVTTK